MLKIYSFVIEGTTKLISIITAFHWMIIQIQIENEILHAMYYFLSIFLVSFHESNAFFLAGLL